MDSEQKKAVLVNVSGGRDSAALYLYALERLGHDFIPVFADTGNEHQYTYEFIANLARRTDGPEIRRVRQDFSDGLVKRRNFIFNRYEEKRIVSAFEAIETALLEKSPYLSLCVLKGIFPHNRQRFCTVELKIMPILRQVVHPLLKQGYSVESWQGIRAQESLARSKMTVFSLSKDGYIIHRPLLAWTVEDVEAMSKRHGLPLNPLYSQGMCRVGCMPCFMARKQEIAEIARRFPEHIEKIRRWERLVRNASKQGISTFFPCTKVPGIHIMRGNVDNVVSWSRTNRKGQFDMRWLQPVTPVPEALSAQG